MRRRAAAAARASSAHGVTDPTLSPQASEPSASGPVPPAPLLVSLGAWSWRLILVSVVVAGVAILAQRVAVAVVPLAVALLFTALLHWPVLLLRRAGLPPALATTAVVLLAAVVLGGVAWFLTGRVSHQSDQITVQFSQVAQDLESRLRRLPGGSDLRLDELVDDAKNWLLGHRTTAVQEVLAAGRIAGELLTGVLLSLFLTFFFLKDGARIWGWLVRLLPGSIQHSVNGAGHRSFQVLSRWIEGSAVIATFHGVVVGLVLWALGTPLVLPLALLVFVGSFIPIIGGLLFGGLAVLVTALTQGLVPGLIILGVLLVDNQVEAHLLQPLIIGRAVRLHPVTVVLALTVGGAVWGVVGAILAVPATAVVHAGIKYLTGIEDLDGNPLSEADRFASIPPRRSAPLPGYGRPEADAAASHGPEGG